MIILLYLRAADLGLVHLPRLPRTDTTWLSRKLMIVVIMFILLMIEEVKETENTRNVDAEGKGNSACNLHCACTYFVWYELNGTTNSCK